MAARAAGGFQAMPTAEEAGTANGRAAMGEVADVRGTPPGGAVESVLEAVLECVTHANEETSCTIARVATERSGRVLLTVVGPLADAQAGEPAAAGRTPHPRYSRQFEVRSCSTVPATIQGIQRYLGSGLVKGIGPVIAGRLERC